MPSSISKRGNVSNDVKRVESPSIVSSQNSTSQTKLLSDASCGTNDKNDNHDAFESKTKNDNINKGSHTTSNGLCDDVKKLPKENGEEDESKVVRFGKTHEDNKKSVLKEIEKRKKFDESLNVQISHVPDVNIKKEIVSPSPQVDISGLELLSNSIEQLMCKRDSKKIDDDAIVVKSSDVMYDEERKELSNDACEGAVLLQNLKNGFWDSENNDDRDKNDNDDDDDDENNTGNRDDGDDVIVNDNDEHQSENSKSLGGLGLLCALAEQRFQEEIVKENHQKIKKEEEEEEIEPLCREEKENKKVNLNTEKESFEKVKSSENFKMEKENEIDQTFKNESVDCDFNRNYPNLNSISNTNNTFKDFAEDDKNVAINDVDVNNYKLNKKLQSEDAERKTTEKERKKVEKADCKISEEQENLIVKRGPGRPKKIKTKMTAHKICDNLRDVRKSKEMSPPILEKQTDYPYSKEDDDNSTDKNYLKLKSPGDILKPPTLTPSAIILDPIHKGKEEYSSMEDSSFRDKVSHETVTKKTIKSEIEWRESESRKRKFLSNGNFYESSLSKKRKVGRPKKHFCTSGSENPLTETIVAKKPKTKSNYLFHSVYAVDNTNGLCGKNTEMEPKKKIWDDDENDKLNSLEKLRLGTIKPHNSSVVDDVDVKNSKKIRPKLKAEPKIKEWISDNVVEDINANDKKKNYCDEDKMKSHKKTLEKIQNGNVKKESKLPSCVITTNHLNSDKFPMRTLTVMGGLFYAGQLSAIRAPDVYGITIDGERGNRPHIYSREEILKDSVSIQWKI